MCRTLFFWSYPRHLKILLGTFALEVTCTTPDVTKNQNHRWYVEIMLFKCAHDGSKCADGRNRAFWLEKKHIEVVLPKKLNFCFDDRDVLFL